jgi:hypothetical protein
VKVKHGSAPAIEDLCGVWVRRSLEWADGRSDTTTRVTWLQGSEWFVDLRLPAVRPSDGARTPQPEAFAGRLVRTLSDATEFMWHRTIDWSPDSGPDVGRLSWDGDNLIEEGVLQPYREVWIRAERHSPDDSATALLRDDTGRLGIVLRSAGFFGFAVGRPLRTGARHLDCEIAVGVITDGGWQIRSSTQIETEGVPICVEIKDKLAVIDVTGPPDCRCLLSGAWHISGTVGDPSLLQTR